MTAGYRFKHAWSAVESISPFIAQVLMTIGANASMALIGLLTGVLAARLLGPEGRGQLAAIQIWPTFIATIAMLGLPESLVFYSAKKPAEAGRYLGSAVVMSVVSSAVFGFAGYLLLPALMSKQPVAVVSAARQYLWIIPIFALVATL